MFGIYGRLRGVADLGNGSPYNLMPAIRIRSRSLWVFRSGIFIKLFLYSPVFGLLLFAPFNLLFNFFGFIPVSISCGQFLVMLLELFINIVEMALDFLFVVVACLRQAGSSYCFAPLAW